ncbi:uncharacterized protein LOC122263031 [Penaeus japonicus]|uniref:uncharacterized protein LOC122255762 n=1 Tax=Penaeus japonicus TaxID=27405 RepID=UPI001C70F17E|nr:uncharacterized protein LOC122255762 [Penaeus japonicus]XP_042885845.1 uncharacterized protein LOC122262021 [Penaeus japonicus]XP_042887253.1 uncharacterized protein LOC122263031 [Penaeus japonicus]
MLNKIVRGTARRVNLQVSVSGWCQIAPRPHIESLIPHTVPHIVSYEQHILAIMKHSRAILLLALLMLVLPVLQAHKFENRKSINKQEEEARELKDEDLEYDDDEEFDLEEEMFGNHNRRQRGINFIDEDLNVVLSEPSDRLLKAIVASEGHPNKVSFEKVKSMHRERMAKVEENSVDRSLFQQDFKELLEKEHEAIEKADEDEGFLNKVIEAIW